MNLLIMFLINQFKSVYNDRKQRKAAGPHIGEAGTREPKKHLYNSIYIYIYTHLYSLKCPEHPLSVCS